MVINLVRLPCRTQSTVRRFLARASVVFLGGTALSVGMVLTASGIFGEATPSSKEATTPKTIRDEVARTSDRLARLKMTLNVQSERREAFKLPRRLLNELGSITPDGVQLERVSLSDGTIKIDGESLTEIGLDEVMIKLSSAVTISDPMPILVRRGESASIEHKKFSITAKANNAKGDY